MFFLFRPGHQRIQTMLRDGKAARLGPAAMFPDRAAAAVNVKMNL